MSWHTYVDEDEEDLPVELIISGGEAPGVAMELVLRTTGGARLGRPPRGVVQHAQTRCQGLPQRHPRPSSCSPSPPPFPPCQALLLLHRRLNDLALEKSKDMHLYNTRSRRREPFWPRAPNGEDGMYICDVMLYNDSHIGHTRAYVGFVVLFMFVSPLVIQALPC
ncbi:Cysteinyl-tRNA synthetase [Hordeum vulgare]|nr:Cysteinyl-tRNA synthetase [Hordeum vulgare]